jgi:hypothetical protein
MTVRGWKTVIRHCADHRPRCVLKSDNPNCSQRPKSFRQLPTQCQSFTSAKTIVWFRKKPPFRFRDRVSSPLMLDHGWEAAEEILEPK